jgi:hypothetical protein
MKDKTPTTRSPKTVNKSGAKTTTKTADGGQLYVRGGAGSKGSYKVPSAAADAYSARGMSKKTVSPRIARSLEEATYLTMDTKNKDNAKFAKKMGDDAAEYAGKVNALTRSRGDKGRR